MLTGTYCASNTTYLILDIQQRGTQATYTQKLFRHIEVQTTDLNVLRQMTRMHFDT